MDIRKRAGFFTLLFESFKLVNNSLPSLVAYFFLAALLCLGIGVVLAFLVPPQLWKVVQLPLNIINMFLTVWLIKIIGAKAEQTGESIFELAFSSFLPAIYLFVIFFLIGLFIGLSCVVLGVVLGFLMPGISPSTKTAVFLVMVGFFLLLMLPFIYVLPAISLRDDGPITAIRSSFRLAWRYPLQTIATVVTMMLIPALVSIGIFGAIYMGIPLYFADSFNLANLSPIWYAVGVMVVLLYCVSWLVSTALLVVMFLNLDYTENRGAITQPTAEQIRLEQDLVKDMNQFSQPIPPVTVNTPQEENASQAEIANAEVGVKVASVRLSTDEETIKEHLDAVYSPENAKVQEYMHQEEDRMPTILFDEDMAKQLEESRKQWESLKNKENRPEDPNGGSIKISKR